MKCYITRTGSYLPGPAVDNEQITQFLGELLDEGDVKRSVLKMNGIISRHYAQTAMQAPTENVYQLAKHAVQKCLLGEALDRPVTFLSGGTTYAPLSGPGIASQVHAISSDQSQLAQALEISSHSGICTSSAAAILHAVRAIKNQEHSTAIAFGAEHASEVLKSTAITPIDDRAEHAELRNSQWFMSVFLRFMLSDGAGAFLLSDRPNSSGVSLAVNWTHSLSMAHEAPLCMKLDNATGLLSQDIRILSRYLFPLAEKFVLAAFEKHQDSLSSYQWVLPHLSSFFFRRKFERLLEQLSLGGEAVTPYWTNLATAGNTGAASIYIMLDEFLKAHSLRDGDRLLLFVPESGQFNFVLISLTVFKNGS
jgi:3-oxoacyl-[acyl-carrier-protein] synthase-3